MKNKCCLRLKRLRAFAKDCRVSQRAAECGEKLPSVERDRGENAKSLSVRLTIFWKCRSAFYESAEAREKVAQSSGRKLKEKTAIE